MLGGDGNSTVCHPCCSEMEPEASTVPLADEPEYTETVPDVAPFV